MDVLSSLRVKAELYDDVADFKCSTSEMKITKYKFKRHYWILFSHTAV